MIRQIDHWAELTWGHAVDMIIRFEHVHDVALPDSMNASD